MCTHICFFDKVIRWGIGNVKKNSTVSQNYLFLGDIFLTILLENRKLLVYFTVAVICHRRRNSYLHFLKNTEKSKCKKLKMFICNLTCTTPKNCLVSVVFHWRIKMTGIRLKWFSLVVIATAEIIDLRKLKEEDDKPYRVTSYKPRHAFACFPHARRLFDQTVKLAFTKVIGNPTLYSCRWNAHLA